MGGPRWAEVDACVTDGRLMRHLWRRAARPDLFVLSSHVLAALAVGVERARPPLPPVDDLWRMWMVLSGCVMCFERL